MMNFFRKHQKKLFIVISVIVIASFTFFGTSATLNTQEIPDKKIGVALDGTSIMEREMHAMVRFLSMGNNEILKNDLIGTGLTALLAEKYFDEVKGEFQERLDKAKRYTPYAHPQAPYLSASQVWARFIPDLPHHLDEVKKGDLSAKTFAAYCDLYLAQVAFPPELLRRILVYEQQQYSWISPDYSLGDSQRLALFDYHSFEEWFGPQFTEILGKFLFNAAAIAEQKGYKVSTDEARAHLLQSCLATLRELPSQQEATYADASDFLRMQLQMSGIDETTAVKVWKKAMLVHRLFNEVGQGMFVDPLAYEQFAAYADEVATVEVYQLPENLRLQDFRSLLKLQYYMEAVAPKAKKIGELPRQFYSPEEVERRVPELVVSQYELEVAKVSKEEVGSRLTLKETWDYEVSDAGWQKLTRQFPVLTGKGDSDEERFAALDSVEANLRLKIDQAARSALIDHHPEWIEEALSSYGQRQKVAIRSRGATAPFDEIVETAALRTHLENSPIGEPGALFTPDQKTYYRFVVWEKPEAKQVMTLHEAQQGDLIGELLDAKLQSAYADVRKKNPDNFKLENGAWKSFSEVRDEVGSLVYADHLRQISSEPLSLEQYPAQRFAALMEQAKAAIVAEGNEASYLKSAGEPLLDQWTLNRQTKEIKRSDVTTLSKADMFGGKQWSEVSMPLSGDLAFFRLIKKGASNPAVTEKMEEGQRNLGTDAKRLLLHQILAEMQ